MKANIFFNIERGSASALGGGEEAMATRRQLADARVEVIVNMKFKLEC